MADAKGKAPDNNKHLAALEAGVSALAIALTANGITLEEGADPIQAAIAAVKQRAELEAQLLSEVPPLEQAIKDRDGKIAELEAKIAAAGTPGTDAAELDELRKRIVELTAEIGELEQDLVDVTNVKNELANQLASDGKGTAPAPAPEPEPEAPAEPPIERSANARDVGPAGAKLTDPAIAALIAEGGVFEIAFSSGEFELVEFGPIKIPASGLTRVDGSRYVVDKAIEVRGGGALTRIHGAGLFYGGEQVGYCAFEPAVKVEPGQQRRFDRALIFG